MIYHFNKLLVIFKIRYKQWIYIRIEEIKAKVPPSKTAITKAFQAFPISQAPGGRTCDSIRKISPRWIMESATSLSGRGIYWFDWLQSREH